jgi:hypothetical protein
VEELWALARLFDGYLAPDRIGTYGGVRGAVTAFKTEEDEQTVNAAREQAESLSSMLTDLDSLDLVVG